MANITINNRVKLYFLNTNTTAVSRVPNGGIGSYVNSKTIVYPNDLHGITVRKTPTTTPASSTTWSTIQGEEGIISEIDKVRVTIVTNSSTTSNGTIHNGLGGFLTLDNPVTATSTKLIENVGDFYDFDISSFTGTEIVLPISIGLFWVVVVDSTKSSKTEVRVEIKLIPKDTASPEIKNQLSNLITPYTIISEANYLGN